jgi:hypothetical protein
MYASVKGRFTPAIWVKKSHEYLAATLGENWQQEYYVWDCAAGTGNLLAGLINKYNITETIGTAGRELFVLFLARIYSEINGSFPIGFKIWDTAIIEPFSQIVADIYDNNGVDIMLMPVTMVYGLIFVVLMPMALSPA